MLVCCVLSIAIGSGTIFAQSSALGSLNRASSKEHPPIHLCRESLSLATSRVFEFVVPANVISPRLTGMIATQSSKIEVLVFNQQQYAAFRKGEPGDAVFANEIRSGNIDLALSSIREQKYYLVLNNSSRHPQTVWADFTVSFE
ncbi:MAG TPA: hypothetical protein VH596_00605 [Terriglobales bacterium]